MLSTTLGRFLSRDPLPLNGQPDIFFDGNGFGEWLTQMRNLYGYASNNPLIRIDPSGLAWWEWIPIVSTVGHYYADVPGDQVTDYPNLTPPKKECREAPELALKKCRDGINGAAMKNLSKWLSVSVGADGTKVLAALVVDALAVWAIKQGIKGGIGGAVTGGILTADAVVDTALIIDGAWAIEKAASQAKDTYCTCNKKIACDASRSDAVA